MPGYANAPNAATPAGSAIIGTVGIDQTTPGTTNGVQVNAGSAIIGSTKDAGYHYTTVWGVSAAPFTSADQHSAVASVTDAPTSGQKIVVDDILISVDTAMSVTFKIETAGTIIYGPFYLPANGSLQFTPRGKGRKLATADKKLQAITSVAGNIMVDVSYHSEA